MAVPVPKMAFATNYRAAEDAKFWMGVCQLEQNMLEPAAETLDAYWRRYQDGGKWIPQAALLRGLALAKAEKYGAGRATDQRGFAALPEGDPRRPTCELFATRWRAARDAANSPGPNSPHQEQAAPKSEPQSPPPVPVSNAPPAATPASAKPGPVSSPPASFRTAFQGPASPRFLRRRRLSATGKKGSRAAGFIPTVRRGKPAGSLQIRRALMDVGVRLLQAELSVFFEVGGNAVLPR